MSKRTVAILLAAFVVLLVLVMVGQRESGAPAGTGAPLIAGLEDALGDIERVTVTKANGETVATLEKRPDNWVVSDKHGYVANAGKLRQALTALGEARILEQKTANAGAVLPARRRGRRGSECGRHQRRADGRGPRAADDHSRQRRGREISLRAPRRRGAELPHRSQSRRAACGGAMGRIA